MVTTQASRGRRRLGRRRRDRDAGAARASQRDGADLGGLGGGGAADRRRVGLRVRRVVRELTECPGSTAAAAAAIRKDAL